MRSNDALRLARHAERFGRDALPIVSEDEVVQWTVEEALMAKLDRHDHEQEKQRSREQATAAAERRVQEQLAARRQGGAS